MELKICSIEKCQKRILDIISRGNLDIQENELIDIFLDLPLKNEAELQVMETKIKEDAHYQKQMVSNMRIKIYLYKIVKITIICIFIS